MDAVFQTVLEMSLSAAVLTAAVILLRLLLRNAPKWILCSLWTLVAVRLLCPVSPESGLSMMPDTQPVTQQIIALQPAAPTVSTPEAPLPGDFTVHVLPDSPQPFTLRFWMVWVTGMAGMLLYMLFSFLRVRSHVGAAIDMGQQVRQCDYIRTPFILGIFRPRIYLPSSLSPSVREHVLAHEQAHLQRKDHWWKPLGFLLLSIHWFNPVLWVAYILLCRDIELACDEKVIRDMDTDGKAAYSEALLSGSVRQRFVSACPLAFGEIGVKARVKSVLSYKKPAFWILLAAVLLSGIVAVCFLTNRPEAEPDTPPSVHKPSAQKTLEMVVLQNHGFMLEAQFDRDYETYNVFVKTDHLTDLPELAKWDKIIVTFNADDDAFDGQLDQVRKIKKMENTAFVHTGLLKGMVISKTGDYVKLRVDTEDAPLVFYVNLKGIQGLRLGDIIQIRYNPGANPTQIDDVTEFLKLQEADWGVILRASSVTPTGFRLYMGYAGGFPRTLVTQDYYYLEKQEGDMWVSLLSSSSQLIPSVPYNMSEGDYYDINWESIYGALEPGHYRFCKPISYDGEQRIYDVEFTVLAPPPTDLAAAVTQTVRYVLSKQLVNPARPHDKTLEHIPQEGATGFLDDPTTSLPEGKTFQQITESHIILDQTQSGDTYTLTVVGMCCGYDRRLLKESVLSPMLLTLRQNTDGTLTATSCKMPTKLSYQADLGLLFSESTIYEILNNSKDHRRALEAACHKQVTGGVIELKGMGQEFAEDSMEAKLILQTIESGKTYKKTYADSSVCTVFLGDTVYYYYYKAHIIHNVTENVYTQLTDEGHGTLKTILGLVN